MICTKNANMRMQLLITLQIHNLFVKLPPRMCFFSGFSIEWLFGDHFSGLFIEVVIKRSSKKVLLKIFQNSQENTCAIVSFLIKLQADVCKFINKETMPQVFSFELCEFIKSTFFIEHLQWLLLFLCNF